MSMTTRAPPPPPPITTGSNQLSSLCSSSSTFVRVVTTTNFFAARDSKGSRYYRHAGFVLGARMNLLDRIARIIKSYIKSFISSLEDSGKILDHIGRDLDLDLSNMRQLKAELHVRQISNINILNQKNSWITNTILHCGLLKTVMAMEAQPVALNYQLTSEDLEAKFELLEMAMILQA